MRSESHKLESNLLLAQTLTNWSMHGNRLTVKFYITLYHKVLYCVAVLFWTN